MRAKVAERAKARELRRNGYTVRHIALLLKVSVASVSVWVRDIPAPPPDPEPVIPLDPKPVGEKWCPRCEQELPLTAFNRFRDGHQGWCRECFREYFRKRGDLHRQQSGDARRRRREEAWAFIRRYRETHPCLDCGQEDPDLLEFDHIGIKKRAISDLVRDAASLKVIKAELKECQVVCANCHRRRTAKQSGSWRCNPDFIEESTHLLPGEKRNLRIVADLLLRSACVDCSESDLRMLEFDHVRGKSRNVGQLAKSGCSEERLLREIDRCEIRCANCHRKRTLQRMRRSIRARRALALMRAHAA